MSGLWHGPRDAPWQQWGSWQSQETTAPLLVLSQVLRLSYATEGILRGEHRQDVLWYIKFSVVERFQTKTLNKNKDNTLFICFQIYKSSETMKPKKDIIDVDKTRANTIQPELLLFFDDENALGLRIASLILWA